MISRLKAYLPPALTVIGATVLLFVLNGCGF
jgi:hypothetical protein